jgi:hypothetical protein
MKTQIKSAKTGLRYHSIVHIKVTPENLNFLNQLADPTDVSLCSVGRTAMDLLKQGKNKVTGQVVCHECR